MAKIVDTKIEEEMEESYINYAMSVIRGRAIPDVRDGLKPVQRRILYGLCDLGLTSDKPHKKSARIVGEVLGKYHPHSDSAVYDTMVNMAQDFSFRYPLVDGQGNFGSIDGDPAAAMRYTEARLSRISETFLEEIEEDTVDFQPNFDDSLEEPTILPTKVPGLLLNGSWGISVGMTTKVPPHNLTELVEALIYLIDNPDASLEEIMQYIKGPDFPTGAIILGREGIEKAYRTGKGKIRMRAKTEIEGNNIIITEIPFQVKKSTIIERIADKAKDETLEDISDIRDESDQEGLRIVVKIKRGAEPEVVLNQLFKYTPLERTFGANALVIVDGNPRRLSLIELLNAFLDFRREVVRRRTQHKLEKSQNRAHILEGIQTALENTERIIELIRDSENRDQARELLIDHFQFSKKQANAILKMQLGRLTSLEREKISEELEQKNAEINRYQEILDSSLELENVIKEELAEIKEKFGDNRKTLITENVEEVETEKLIPDRDLIFQLTENGQTNSPRRENFSTQKRGGKGVISLRVDESDRIICAKHVNTREDLVLFSDKDQAYKIKSYRLPSLRRDSKGEPLGKHLEIEEGERIESALTLGNELVEESFCVLVTKGGFVTKYPLNEFSSALSSGIQAINTEEGDQISSSLLTYGEGEILIATRNGQAIRFDQSDLRSIQRPAKGVIGIEVSPNDQVTDIASLESGEAPHNKNFLLVTEKGLGKKVPLQEFSSQSRGGKGNLAIKLEENDGLAGGKVVGDGKEVMLVSERGKAIRLSVDDVSKFQRYARGVKLMELAESDRIASVTVV